MAPAHGHWKSGRWLAVEKSYNGATTFSIKTFIIATFIITTFSITTFSITTFSIMGLFVTVSINNSKLTVSGAVMLRVVFIMLC